MFAERMGAGIPRYRLPRTVLDAEIYRRMMAMELTIRPIDPE